MAAENQNRIHSLNHVTMDVDAADYFRPMDEAAAPIIPTKMAYNLAAVGTRRAHAQEWVPAKAPQPKREPSIGKKKRIEKDPFIRRLSQMN